MRERLLLGLVGPANAGKDMVASRLKERWNFKRFAFADRIKQEYFATIRTTEAEFKTLRGTAEEERVRQALWNHSDDVKRRKGDSYFVDLVMDDVRRWPGAAVITDVRTRLELNAIRQAGGIIMLVVRGQPYRCAADEAIPDSRLAFGDLMPDDLVFRNVRRGLGAAQGEFDKFYSRCVLNSGTEDDMDSDSGPQPDRSEMGSP